MRLQESNYMYSSFAKSTIKNQNTQLTEKSVGITIQMFPDYPIEKSQYPINKKNQWVLPNSPKFLIWSSKILSKILRDYKSEDSDQLIHAFAAVRARLMVLGQHLLLYETTEINLPYLIVTYFSWFSEHVQFMH